MERKFAEVLYMLKMTPDHYDDYLFSGPIFLARFPGITRDMWLAQAAKIDEDMVRNHLSALKNKEATVEWLDTGHRVKRSRGA